MYTSVWLPRKVDNTLCTALNYCLLMVTGGISLQRLTSSLTSKRAIETTFVSEKAEDAKLAQRSDGFSNKDTTPGTLYLYKACFSS